MGGLFWERLVTVVLVFFANGVDGVVPALFAFGDSILDTGNNNVLGTFTRCNFPPYGRNFFGAIPTGRFCDGKVPSDLIASALGIKETLPAFLSPYLRNEDIPTGVSFASGGSGSDISTAGLQKVLSLPAQLRNFQRYILRLRALVGVKRASYIISNALVLISSGNNDIAITYSLSLRIFIPFPFYANSLVASSTKFIQALYGLGVRRVWMLSTLPLGCLPAARTLAAGLCNPLLNLNAQILNAKLLAMVQNMRSTTPYFDIRFIDVYTPLLSIIQNPYSAGFVNAARGCCGSGTLEMEAFCNVWVGSCLNPSTHVFWDSAHPTQRAYQLVVSYIMRSNNLSSFASSNVNPVSHSPLVVSNG